MAPSSAGNTTELRGVEVACWGGRFKELESEDVSESMESERSQSSFWESRERVEREKSISSDIRGGWGEGGKVRAWMVADGRERVESSGFQQKSERVDRLRIGSRS